MESFIINTGIALALAIIITLFKLKKPKESYKWKTSLKLGIIAILTFAIIFLIAIILESWSAFWPIIYCLLFCFYVYKGYKSVAYKTATGVFSRITNELVGRIEAGLRWADPIYEVVTVSVDGIPNISVDLQQLEIEIVETPEMHTSTRGIKAKVRNVIIMLEVIKGKIPQLFEIEGSSLTVRERVASYINFFFLDEIGKIKPVDLDEDKGETLKNLAEKLKDSVNKFCKDNHYPYKIPQKSVVTIGDTELETKYYEVLAKKEFTKLEQDGFDVEAERIRTRLLDLGNHLLPTATENEKLKAAMVALKITPKTIEEKTYGVSTEISVLLKELAEILKK